MGTFFALGSSSKAPAGQAARPTGAVPCPSASALSLPTTRPDRPPTPDQLREAEQLNLQGLALIGRQEYDRGLDLLNRALKLNPKHAAAWNNHGLAHLKMGDYARAIDDCTKALEYKPDYATAYLNRGIAYFNQQKYEKAIDDYNHSIDLEPNNDITWNNRGAAYFSLGKYDKALENLNRAVRINPTIPTPTTTAAPFTPTCASTPRPWKNTRTPCLNPKNFQVYFNRGDLYLKKEDYDRAIEDFTRAIALEPEYARAFALRSQAHARLNHKREADDDLAERSRLDPNLAKLPK